MIDNDKIISQLTVRLSTKVKAKKNRIGSGVLCHPAGNAKVLYVITAAHCLFSDGERFAKPLEKINVEVYDLRSNLYQSFEVRVDTKLLYLCADKDVAVLLMDRLEIEAAVGEIPDVPVARDEYGNTQFIIKGFPNGTQGEIDVLYPTWQQRMTEVHKFQLNANKSYTNFYIKGYSGSGVFMLQGGQIYLVGIFTRYRGEEKGNVIYCQYLDTVNELLESNYMTAVPFSFVGKFGLDTAFFQRRLKIALKNLGPRFNEQLNFRLPVAQKFSDLAKDSFFRRRVHLLFNGWLVDKSYRRLRENPHVGVFELRIDSFKATVIQWLNGYDFTANNPIDVSWVVQGIREINEELEDKSQELFGLRRDSGATQDVDRDRFSKREFDDELSRLREMERVNTEFLYDLEYKLDVSLINNPFLLIKGDAGEGKSHLLGDIANERLKKGQPALLLLGQLFKGSGSIQSQILEQLELTCTFSEFLETLNSIGYQTNARVLLMVDALNESKMMDIWNDGLAGLIDEVSGYPYIAFVFTVRSTYYDYVIPEELRSQASVLKTITHEGFSGKEYEALKLFCHFYGLKQPTFPIVAPEFTNPLFLQMVCIGVSNSKDKAFPVGFHGIQQVFDQYIAAMNKKLMKKPEYTNRVDLVRNAIETLALESHSKADRYMTLKDTEDLFDNRFPRFPNLLTDLIQENVLLRSLTYTASSLKVETVSFAFERFGDYIIAKELLASVTTAEEVLTLFAEGGSLAALYKGYYNDGLLEALSVLIPERYGIEIFELLDWKIVAEQDEDFRSERDTITRYFLRSMKWRTPESIDLEKIRRAFDEDKLDINDAQWFSTALEFSAIPGHPLNSDYLHELLNSFSMPERDGFWQDYLLDNGYHEYSTEKSPLVRLIDWAWTPGISEQVDEETARLTAQCLAWVLSSPIIGLRDRATKALVNLLQQQPLVLTNMIQAFKETDDMYIQERLYAVAYGCILRCNDKAGIHTIAAFVYNAVFSLADPPLNILLRDYARNICEYGIKSDPALVFDMTLARPPYKSEVPVFPTKKDMEQFQIPYNPNNEDNTTPRVFNSIHHSVVNDDFGNKVIDAVVRNFSGLNVGAASALKALKATLGRNERKAVTGVERCAKLLGYQAYFKIYDRDRPPLIDDQGLENIRRMMEKELAKLSDKDAEWMRRIAIPYIKASVEKAHEKRAVLQQTPIKYWIVQRAFSLGWSLQEHGSFDSNAGQYNNRHNNAVERIGKKYQWIAFYEIMAIIADNFKLQRGFGSSHDQFYKGAWEMFLRNIDPAYITPASGEDAEGEDMVIEGYGNNQWWSKPGYSHWNIPNQQWAYQLDDLPSMDDVLIKTDTKGQRWLHLRHDMDWNEPKPLGADQYGGLTKRLVYMVRGYLVRKNDKSRIVSYLRDKNFYGLWMPDGDNGFSRLINREKFWSPAYKENGRDSKWSTIPGTTYKVMMTTTVANGGMDSDKSGANKVYNMPCQTIFEGMGLRYADNDGDFLAPDGTTVVCNPEREGMLIRLDAFEAFLAEKKLEVMWTLLAEKIADSGERHEYHFGVPCGVFTLEKGEVKGQMLMHERD